MNHGQGTNQCYRHDNSKATQQSDQKQFCMLNSSEGHMLRLWGTHSALQLWSCYFILMGPFYFQIHTKLTTKFTIPSSVQWTDFPLSLLFRDIPQFSGCFLKNCLHPEKVLPFSHLWKRDSQSCLEDSIYVKFVK